MALSTNLTLLKSMQNFLREGFNQGICLIEASKFPSHWLSSMKRKLFVSLERKKKADRYYSMRQIYTHHAHNEQMASLPQSLILYFLKTEYLIKVLRMQEYILI